jgi:predicted nucleic acid-binding protein
VRRVRSDGPQHVTVRGHEEVVVVSAEEFRRLKGDRTGVALIAALQASPYRENDIAPRREQLRARCEAVRGWLLDTNVLSELRRPKPNPNVVSFVGAKPLDLLFASIVTLPKSALASSRLPALDHDRIGSQRVTLRSQPPPFLLPQAGREERGRSIRESWSRFRIESRSHA